MGRKKQAETVIQVQDVTKSFRIGERGGQTLEVLRGITMPVEAGHIVAVVGASGAGKSTLLHIIGTLDRPSGGSVYYNGVDVFGLSEEELARFRNKNIGFVFQFHHLLPEFSSLENTAMPALIAGERTDVALAKAAELLKAVGLKHREEHKPPQLSGGEQQRVAVARALINDPLVVLADEPTGNLDSATASGIHELLWGLNRDRGQTLVIVTHNEKLAREADRVVRILDGKVEPGKALN
jgi:lipoprotein-releasing system ATP-binding protein